MFNFLENIKNTIELLINIVLLPIKIINLISNPFELRRRKENKEDDNNEE